MADTFEMIAKTFFGLEGVLADELAVLGALDLKAGRRMVAFRGDREFLYLANIHCRTAVRVLMPIHAFTANDERQLYDGIGLVDWQRYLSADGSLAIDPVVHSPIFTNSLYAAQRAKDAIVDQIRDRAGRRPSVDLDDPDLRINLHVADDRVTVYLDSSGDSLHKRGYRTEAGSAPLNEVLAAGILRLTGWDGQSPLADFMCGSGTLVIEAALAARRIAPGTIRKRFGYQRWPDYCRATHDRLMAEARAEVLPRLDFPLQGSDLDPAAIAIARDNARRAGVDNDIRWLVENFESVRPPAATGTLVTNPPYDERMKAERMSAVYRRLGEVLRRNWGGHTAWILTGNLAAAGEINLRSSRKIRLFNGPIECRLIKFPLFERPASDRPAPAARGPEQEADFSNRLARMAKHWHRWARRQAITCYRIYDRDVPDVPLSVDWYEGQVVITEHERPHARTDIEQQAWLQRMREVAARTLDIPPDIIALVARAGDPDARLDSTAQTIECHEGPMRFEVRPGSRRNGLPLDRRVLRSMVRDQAAGKRVLELFAGTGAFSVAALVGGAVTVTAVEASRGLAAWIEANLRLNGATTGNAQVVCQDPLEFVRSLQTAGEAPFDLIVVEPPSFGGKRRAGVWNVQDGHAELIGGLLEVLAPGGKIYFMTTFRRLKFQAERISHARAHEITRQTIPPDFRDKKVHRAWVVSANNT